jgi:hypothetical protein
MRSDSSWRSFYEQATAFQLQILRKMDSESASYVKKDSIASVTYFPLSLFSCAGGVRAETTQSEFLCGENECSRSLSNIE